MVDESPHVGRQPSVRGPGVDARQEEPRVAEPGSDEGHEIREIGIGKNDGGMGTRADPRGHADRAVECGAGFGVGAQAGIGEEPGVHGGLYSESSGSVRPSAGSTSLL